LTKQNTYDRATINEPIPTCGVGWSSGRLLLGAKWNTDDKASALFQYFSYTRTELPNEQILGV
jgi:hypothetical protein